MISYPPGPRAIFVNQAVLSHGGSSYVAFGVNASLTRIVDHWQTPGLSEALAAARWT